MFSSRKRAPMPGPLVFFAFEDSTALLFSGGLKMEKLPEEEVQQLLPALGGEEQQVMGLLEVPLGTCCNFT